MSNGTGQLSQRSHWAAAVIASYLVVHQAVLCYLAAVTWLAPGWKELVQCLSWLICCLPTELTAPKFTTFQNLVIAACASGLGGGVYMVRELYIKYAYGRWEKVRGETGYPIMETVNVQENGKVVAKERPRQKLEYLQREEIPRYVLLPFSSVIMGPILYGLARGGILALTGNPTGDATDISRVTVLVLCFVLGFTYHDTLGFFTKLSKAVLRRWFDKNDKDK